MTDTEIKKIAKEKAEYLIFKHKSKEHALITVNEILESFGVSLSEWQMEFWEIVKQELKNGKAS